MDLEVGNNVCSNIRDLEQSQVEVCDSSFYMTMMAEDGGYQTTSNQIKTFFVKDP